jgi:HK97 family phage prohead protease
MSVDTYDEQDQAFADEVRAALYAELDRHGISPELLRANASEPYGPASQAHYADPGYQADGKKRYPLDSEEHCRAAWSYVNQERNAAKYSPEQLARIKARIKAAGKKYGIDFADDGRAASTGGLCTRAFDFTQDGAGGDGRTLEGYAAVFNSTARIKDMQGDFDEVILPGAFKRSLEQRMPVLQFDHGKDPRIGGVPIGTIERLAEDSRGLHVRARLFTHPDVERVREAIAGKAVKGMSFRFAIAKGGDKWTSRGGDVDLREIREAETHELGPVVFPAYDHTSVSVRSLLAAMAPDEIRTLVHELAAHTGLAVDLTDLTGRPGARSAGGGDNGRTREDSRPSDSLPARLALDGDSLRLRGIL